MLHQFKRAVGVGVAIVRGNAKHKMGRLHYFRATECEAAAVHTKHMTVIVAENLVRMDRLAGSKNISPRGTVQLNSSGMGTIYVCIKLRKKSQPQHDYKKTVSVMCNRTRT